MAKFFGKLGYAEAVKTAPGVTEDIIIERKAFGDVLRAGRRLEGDSKIIPDIQVNNSISLIADAYTVQHINALRYVMWEGVAWTVSEVTVERPRLILRLGGVYNGPKAATV